MHKVYHLVKSNDPHPEVVKSFSTFVATKTRRAGLVKNGARSLPDAFAHHEGHAHFVHPGFVRKHLFNGGTRLNAASVRQVHVRLYGRSGAFIRSNQNAPISIVVLIIGASTQHHRPGRGAYVEV